MSTLVARVCMTLFGCGCCLATTHAASVAPLSLRLTDPHQTVGLTVVEIALPQDIFTAHTAGVFTPQKWQVVVQQGVLQQLYFAPTATEERVFLYGLLRQPHPCVLAFTPSGEPDSRPAFTVTIHPEQASPGDAAVLSAWSQARNHIFTQYAEGEAQSHLMHLWQQRAAKVYGGAVAEPSTAGTRHRRPPAPRQNLTAWSLFSGAAAIEETLQMQLLQGTDNAPVAVETLQDLQGPAVPSHPFASLLQGTVGGALPIADLVPPARYFVHIGQPDKTLPWLDQMAMSGSQIIGLQPQASLDWGLIDRYLGRLHLSRQLATQLGRLARQVAFFGPDLYFTDGTDITVVAEVRPLPGFDRLLQALVGGGSTVADGVHRYGNQSPAYVARHDHWLILSTSQAEAAAAWQRARDGGHDSLGRSAEFRYMTSLLPAEDESHGLFIYFSDPFIRAMIGPRSKIGQLRRVQARARLHLVTAGSLLYRLDHDQTPQLEELVRWGYIDPAWLRSWEGDHITLDAQGIARSSLYGTLVQMTPLAQLPMEAMSTAERDGYRQYVDAYASFWRTYFDPIGIRIRVATPLQVETLILPLVHNSIYDVVRLVSGGEPFDLQVPTLQPAPVTMLSLKLTPEALQLLVGERYTSRGKPLPPWLDLLGQRLHIAFYDNDPLIALGSADLLGAFSGMWLGGRRGADFIGLGLVGSMLTQPTTLFIELQDIPEGSIEPLLRQMIAEVFGGEFDRFASTGLEQYDIAGNRAWVFTLEAAQVLRLHLYIQRLGTYLAVSNRRIAFTPLPGEPDPQPANVRLHVDLSRIDTMAASLHLHHMQYQRRATMQQMGRLLPWFFLGATTVQDAMAQHAEVYGSRPVHPTGGEWRWHPPDRRLVSTLFGSLQEPRLPSPDVGAEASYPPGLLDQLSRLDLRFRFEQEGVRVIVTLQAP